MVDVVKDGFDVALIPVTLRDTTLGVLQVGDLVNLEADGRKRSTKSYVEELRAKWKTEFPDEKFLFVTGGIIKNVRPVRFTGLAIFLIATIKVIAFDLRSLDPLYRIIAFIVLGIALLGGAFVYIRFENILNGNSTPNNTDGTPDV